MTNDTETEIGLNLNRLLGESVVCISGSFVPINDQGNNIGHEASFTSSAFAMSFAGHPVLVTAGHVIKDLLDPIFIDNKHNEQRIRITGCFICDFFGTNPRVTKPTPFDYTGTLRWSIDQSLDRESYGLDFGLIFMRDFWWKSLSGNGVMPLGEERWVVQKDAVFDTYRMAGFPFNVEHARQGVVQLVSYKIVKVDDPSISAPNGEPAWFVGKLPEGVTDVRGVSGGPIFGFKKLGDNSWHYEVVAVQSWQNSDRRIVYGTPVMSFAPTVKQLVTDARQKLSDAQLGEN